MSSVDFNKIFEFAQYSQDAYSTLDEIKQKFGDSLIACGEEEEHDIRYFLIEKGNEVYLSFRGTADLENALTDGEYVMHKSSDLGVYVHKGFYEAFKSSYKSLAAVLEPRFMRSVPINITGHSLGGAVAAIALMSFSLKKVNLGRTITFGQPKVTNNKGVKKYDNLNLLRVVDEEDLVPLVPPNTLLSEIHGGYGHFGREVLLLEGQNYSLLKERAAEQSKVSSFWDNIGRERLKDHFIANYIKRINEKIPDSLEVPYKDRSKYE